MLEKKFDYFLPKRTPETKVDSNIEKSHVFCLNSFLKKRFVVKEFSKRIIHKVGYMNINILSSQNY